MISRRSLLAAAVAAPVSAALPVHSGEFAGLVPRGTDLRGTDHVWLVQWGETTVRGFCPAAVRGA